MELVPPSSPVSTSPVPASAAGITLHLIGSAHLDPVWLWDWREGMNEGIATCRAMVAMLHEFPDFRFIRGEAAVYDHVERHAPELFADIRRLVCSGQWDVVGGNWIQPDTNLPATEALLRQFVRGKRYFRKKFGVDVTAAWAADSFGHSAGMPDILAAAGFDSFAFTRPQENILPLRRQAFWWRGRSGARILAYRPHDGWYASERAGIGKRLDLVLERAAAEGLETVAMFYGLGNHGGGPSRAHLREIQAWAETHPEVRVRHSGLHALFTDLRAEIARRGDDLLDTIDGELNFCLRGCSASVARFKYAYRRAESSLLRAERTTAACLTSAPTVSSPKSASLDSVWDTLLFNAFHDILPGSSIERAYDDQLAQVGSVLAEARRAETDALTGLAARIDTTSGSWKVPDDHPWPQPVLIWNPHPWSLRTQVEIEVSLDHRPLWAYHGKHHEAPIRLTDAEGRRLPYQLIAEEHDSMVDLLWRRRAVVSVELPPMGWRLVQMGLDPLGVVVARAKGGECAGAFDFVVSAEKGALGVTLSRGGREWLPGGLQVRLYADTWGAWGGMNEERDSWLLSEELERLVVVDSAELESGPLRRVVWVRFTGGKYRSALELTLIVAAGAPHVELRARAFLADRGARLKLVMPAMGGAAEFDVPGGVVRRDPCGEVPGGRWVRVGQGEQAVGFASNALYGFDTTRDELRATIARSSRYGSDVNRLPTERPWQPCADLGEHVFRALLTPDVGALPRLADVLEEPPVVLTVPAHRPVSGERLEPVGAFLDLHQKGLRLLALLPAADNALELRLQNSSSVPLSPSSPSVAWAGHPLVLPRNTELAPGEIATWLLTFSSDSPRAWPTVTT